MDGFSVYKVNKGELELEKRGFYFKTPNNTYFYNDATGNVTLSDSTKGEKVIFGKGKTGDISVDKNELKEYLYTNGFRQLILIVTENCNLRCKYCLYSGEYENSRNHSFYRMSLDVAKEAVQKYLNSVKEIKKIKPIFSPVIGFYGGEPLLNFKLIKQIVQYVKEIYTGEVYFNITSNATLLDEEKIDFLVKNKFFLSVSLNGYQEENDRMRVYINGKGTYSDIMAKLKLIRDRSPEYYQKNVQIVDVFDTGTDLIKLREFYLNNELVFEKLANVLKVAKENTNWYDQYSEEQQQNQKRQLQTLKKKFMSRFNNHENIDPLLKILFALPVYEMINRPMNISLEEIKPSFLPYTGMCVPGVKIAVDPKGVLHSCEKVNDKAPLGTVDEWLNFDKIAKTLEKYNVHVSKQCSKCPIQRLCPNGFRGMLTDSGDFDRTQLTPCQNIIDEKREIFKVAYTFLEKNIDLDKMLQK